MPRRSTLSRPAQIAVLQLFNDKAERLEQLSYTEYVRSQGVGLKVSAKVGSETTFTVRVPTPEQTQAFALTLSFFFKNNEPISFKRLSALYPRLGVAPELVEQYLDGYQKLNGFLERPSQVNLRGVMLSNRDILEVYLWGELAHSTRKAEFDAWAAEPLLLAYLTMLFNGIAMILLNFIYWVKHHNIRAIEALRGKPEAPGEA